MNGRAKQIIKKYRNYSNDVYEQRNAGGRGNIVAIFDVSYIARSKF